MDGADLTGLLARATAGALRITALVLLASGVSSASAGAGSFAALPPLQGFFEPGRAVGDGIEFDPSGGRWEQVRIDPVEPVSDRSSRWDEWLWFVDEEGFRGRAEDRAEGWLGLEELELGDRRVRASREFGHRLRLSSFTGYRSSSQRMIRAEYELGRGLVLRSEARERGESRIVVEREQTFR